MFCRFPKPGNIILSIIMMVLVACHGGEKTLKATVEQTHDFALNSELTVRNVDGSIRVYCSDRPGLTLLAVKKAYSAERLNKIEIKVSDDRGAITIDTIFPPKREGWNFSDRSGTVDYIIIVPQSTRIKNLELVNGEISIDGLIDGSARARLTNGRMFAQNCFGNLDLGLRTGGLDFYYDWCEARNFTVEGAIENGSVKAALPRGCSFRADVETTDGRVVNNCTETRTRRADGKKLQITIGTDAGPRFRLRVAHGDIKFEKAY